MASPRKNPLRSETTPWTETQDQVVLDTLRLTPVQAMREINRAGPTRTLRAVHTRRRDIRARGLPVKRYAPWSEPRGDGWPTLCGSPEDRDRGFVRSVLRAQLDQVRAAA
jgi:hypothetical protein